MKKRKVKRLDLFSGAGGASTGGDIAFEAAGVAYEGYAINHWNVSCKTYNANHPHMRAICMGVEELVLSRLFPGRTIDYCWASPTCTHFSRARGGLPCDAQMRSQPYLVSQLASDNWIRCLTVENVPEFINWGPLDRDLHPIEKEKGKLFREWVDSLRAARYNVEWKIVNCADYGDATTRKRFFLKAVKKGCGEIRWPSPTHAQRPGTNLFNMGLLPWRPVRECIDFSDLGTSIFGRKNPLKPSTLQRIFAGLKKYDGIDFIVRLNRNCDCESLEDPISVITAGGQHHVLCQPLIVDHFGNGKAVATSGPLGTQTTHDRFSLVTPFIMDYFGLKANHPQHLKDVGSPLPTITTEPHHYLCTPLVLGQQSGSVARSVSEPCPTISTAGAVRLVIPAVLDSAAGLPRLPDGRYLDVRIRMLKPSELAAAHSFPKGYVFHGTRMEQVRQIGNSVPVRTAAAMCRADLEAA